MEAKLSVLLHLVGCTSPASWCSAPPSFCTFVSFRTELDFVCRGGGCGAGPARSRFPPRLPTQDVIPAQGHTPLPMGSGIPHASELPLTVHTLRRGGGGRARGAPGPQAKNKGAGAAPAVGHAHREPRGRARAPPPGRAKWRPRYKMAAGWAAEWRPEAPSAGSPRPVFLPTLSLRPSRSRAAGEGVRARVPSPLVPGSPSEDWHVRAPT